MSPQFINEVDIEHPSISPDSVTFHPRSLMLCPWEVLRRPETWRTELWKGVDETKQNALPRYRGNLELARSSGWRGRRNLLWSRPSVRSKSTPLFGSAASCCNVHMTVLSQYWECKWDLYPCSDPNFCSNVRPRSDSCCL